MLYRIDSFYMVSGLYLELTVCNKGWMLLYRLLTKLAIMSILSYTSYSRSWSHFDSTICMLRLCLLISCKMYLSFSLKPCSRLMSRYIRHRLLLLRCGVLRGQLYVLINHTLPLLNRLDTDLCIPYTMSFTPLIPYPGASITYPCSFLVQQARLPHVRST